MFLSRLILFASTVTALLNGQYYDERYEFFDDELFEGDIILTDSQRQLIYYGYGIESYSAREGYRWPNGTIPYEITQDHSKYKDRSDYTEEEKEQIEKAIKKIEQRTCVKFVPKTEDHKYYIDIRNETGGCSSHVGRCTTKKCKKEGQRLNLGTPWCFRRNGNGKKIIGTIVHELMHAIGFWHEQSRPDRDDHVTIIWNNIRNGKEHNFRKVHIGQANMVGPYEICSVMHYSGNAWRKDYIPKE